VLAALLAIVFALFVCSAAVDATSFLQEVAVTTAIAAMIIILFIVVIFKF
jgi:hypothetical protein